MAVAELLLKDLGIVHLSALGATGTLICTVGLNHILHVHASFLLEVVDVLGEVLPQETLVLEQLSEIVRGSRIVL